jgi:ribosomal-protein-serine acetyltransferase
LHSELATVGEEYQGLGIMTRTCKGLIHHAFNELGINRIEIRACTGNEKSRAITERLGFKLEGTIRQAELLHERFHDHVVYGMLAEDFEEHL